MLSNADVVELSQLAVPTLQHWVEGGVVVPTEPGGKGRGNGRKFDLMNALGVVVGARVYRSDQGCHLDFLKNLVAAFSAWDEAEMLAEFRKGKTHLVMVHYGKPLLSPPRPYWVDVKQAYRDVKAAYLAVLEKMAKEVVKSK